MPGYIPWAVRRAEPAPDDPKCRNCGLIIQNWGESSMSGPARVHWVHLSTRSHECTPGERDTSFAFPMIRQDT
jgi:hypothetical protein